MTKNIHESFTAEQAANLCGFGSVAMLDYLQRSQVFLPTGRKGKARGKPRQYTFRDLMTLKAIKRLLDSGASVANLKKSLVKFQKENWSADPGSLGDKNGIIRYLIVSAEKIYLRKNADVLIELSHKGQLTFSFIIDLDNLHNELKKDLGYPVAEQVEIDFEKLA